MWDVQSSIILLAKVLHQGITRSHRPCMPVAKQGMIVSNLCTIPYIKTLYSGPFVVPKQVLKLISFGSENTTCCS